MSQSKKKLFSVLFVFLVLAMASMACGGSDDVVAAPVELTEAEQRRETMSAAGEMGQSVFVYHGDTAGIAICMGTEKLVSFKEPGKEYWFKFSVQETLNLSLCSRNAETGNYSFTQDISGVRPGQYLSWAENGQLSWTR